MLAQITLMPNIVSIWRVRNCLVQRRKACDVCSDYPEVYSVKISLSSAFICHTAFKLTRCYIVFALLQSITDYRELAFRMGRFYKNIPTNYKQDKGPRVSVLYSLQQYHFPVENCSFFPKKSITAISKYHKCLLSFFRALSVAKQTSC